MDLTVAGLPLSPCPSTWLHLPPSPLFTHICWPQPHSTHPSPVGKFGGQTFSLGLMLLAFSVGGLERVKTYQVPSLPPQF